MESNSQYNNLLRRVRYQLRKEGERLLAATDRLDHWYHPYYIVDGRNIVIAGGCDPVSLADEMGIPVPDSLRD